MVCAEARPRNLMVEEDFRTMSAVTMCPLIELNIPVKEILTNILHERNFKLCCIFASEYLKYATIIVARSSLDLPVDASPLHGEDARPGVHEVGDDLAAGVSHDALIVVTLVAVARERGRVF